eukprot:6552734-Karenia_brevis.AAC.1
MDSLDLKNPPNHNPPSAPTHTHTGQEGPVPLVAPQFLSELAKHLKEQVLGGAHLDPSAQASFDASF